MEEQQQRMRLSERFASEIEKTVVGRKDVIKIMLVSLFSQSHVLLEGNPGLGKTTLAKAFAQTIGGEFTRIQMTPDILPADILGTYVYDQKKGVFSLRKGPIFAHIVLVDELNRATPKAQSALLESMQERQVSLERETIRLTEPFIVFATQVAFGTAGTYPLSEVQSDRFAFSVPMRSPSVEDEKSIMTRIDQIESSRCETLLTADEIVSNIERVREIYVSDPVKDYIIALSTYLRNSPSVKSSPSPRASIALYKGARALALLDDRDHVIPDDVKFLAPYVFQHRVFLKSDALIEDITASGLISEMLAAVPVPKGEAAKELTNIES